MHPRIQSAGQLPFIPCSFTVHFPEKTSAPRRQRLPTIAPQYGNCSGAIISCSLEQAQMKLRLTSCSAAPIHYTACIQRRSGTKMADTQCAVKVKSPVSINIMVCPPGCSTRHFYYLEPHRTAARPCRPPQIWPQILHVIGCHTCALDNSTAANDILSRARTHTQACTGNVYEWKE